MVVQQPIIQKIYYQMNTTNRSFIDMHNYLQGRGIKNNKFFLVLLDPDLANINPHDPRLNTFMKQKVLRECMVNFWYFVREVVRIPEEGGQAGSGMPYKLHRGNLALNFGFIKNWNMFLELPRQNFKTMSAIAWYLWCFNFGTTNSEMMYINKKHDDSKNNLQRLKRLREALPLYLRMDSPFNIENKKKRPEDRAESLEHPSNGNKIKTLPAARNKTSANSLGRGCTQPLQWYDEYAFIPHNGTIYLAATPAYSTASENAARNGRPFGILITTTPGDMTTDEGLEAFETKDNATVWSENFYDMTNDQLRDLMSKNDNSKFVYIKYTYQQLGRSEEWFKNMCLDMKKKWADIRREVLLEWSDVSDNSPFRKEDLNIVKTLIKQPIQSITVCKYYQLHIYEKIADNRYPPILGVDVSGGFRKDSSTITVIDSKTTRVTATLNCNYISPGDLACVIYEIVTRYIPNCIVNVERNGGYGAAVISKLMKTSIKRNLYYEIKDRVIEERFVNGHIEKQKTKVKVFGLDSSKEVRNNLMEILRDRMEYHKDKFICPVIFQELNGLEVKRSGKIEHSSNSHDDQIFSYLLALYVWYEGRDLMERYGLIKESIRSDEELEDGIIGIEEKYENIVEELQTEQNEIVAEQIEILNQYKNVKTYQQFIEEQHEEDVAALEELKLTPLGRKTLRESLHIDTDDIEGHAGFKIPDKVFKDFYN